MEAEEEEEIAGWFLGEGPGGASSSDMDSDEEMLLIGDVESITFPLTAWLDPAKMAAAHLADLVAILRLLMVAYFDLWSSDESPTHCWLLVQVEQIGTTIMSLLRFYDDDPNPGGAVYVDLLECTRLLWAMNGKMFCTDPLPRAAARLVQRAFSTKPPNDAIVMVALGMRGNGSGGGG